jgi:excisionase family DNA binding protein
MNTLYTVRQVQDILKVDRITIYRMLQDGRLKGMKIGQQWRFSQDEVQRLLGGNEPGSSALPQVPLADSSFPTHCVQTIQNLFSEISNLPGLTVDLNGELLTEISKPSSMMLRMLGTIQGRNLCRETWIQIVRESAVTSGVMQSREGFYFAAAPVYDTDAHIGAFISGQFYASKPDPYEELQRVSEIARKYQLDAGMLQEEIKRTPVIPFERHPDVAAWVLAASHAIQSILKERTGFILRLQQIADLTQLS